MSAPKITDQPDNPFVIFNIECNIQWKIYCTVLGYWCEKKNLSLPYRIRIESRVLIVIEQNRRGNSILIKIEMIKTILKLQMFFAPQFPTLTVFTDVRCYINILFIVCDLWNSLDSLLHQTSVLIEYITEVAALWTAFTSRL